jgi:isoleucyl-tRNA synthetase
MRRVEDVLDVWFDSGSMSFAQVHYPFENRDWFEHHFPGDFIVEYIGQTRGWFYTLHILATALFDRPAFSSCVSHGVVLGSDGQKMSKSLRNYPDVSEVFDRDGADAMRWFLMSSPILRGNDLIVTERGIRDGVRQVLIPLWNAWSFFSLYANAADGGSGYRAQWSTSSTDVLDRYLLAKLRDFVATMQAQMDAYEIANACDTMRGFLDVLTNWYIRRSRDRFWGGEDQSARAAFDTLFTTLETVCRVVAPLLPLTTEEIWRGLTGGRSVHLTDWPSYEDLPEDETLVASMDRARAVLFDGVGSAQGRFASGPPAVVLAHRRDAGCRCAGAVLGGGARRGQRQRGPAGRPGRRHRGRLRRHPTAHGERPRRRARLGRDVQTAIKAAKSGDWWMADDGNVTAGGLVLEAGEYTVETVVERSAGRGDQAVAMLPGAGFVVLDTAVTPELGREGLANDLVRAVQQARRDAGLHVSDRISLTVTGDQEVFDATVAHRDHLVGETLATQFAASPTLDDLPGEDGVAEVTVGDGHRARVQVRRKA